MVHGAVQYWARCMTTVLSMAETKPNGVMQLVASVTVYRVDAAVR